MYKAMVARITQNVDDSKRLLDLILKDDPGDAEAAVSLRGLLENLQKTSPARLRSFRGRPEASPTTQICCWSSSGWAAPRRSRCSMPPRDCQQHGNPVDKKLAEMEVARQKKDLPGDDSGSDEAEKLAPNDVRVMVCDSTTR